MILVGFLDILRYALHLPSKATGWAVVHERYTLIGTDTSNLEAEIAEIALVGSQVSRFTLETE